MSQFRGHTAQQSKSLTVESIEASVETGDFGGTIFVDATVSGSPGGQSSLLYSGTISVNGQSVEEISGAITEDNPSNVESATPDAGDFGAAGDTVTVSVEVSESGFGADLSDSASTTVTLPSGVGGGGGGGDPDPDPDPQPPGNGGGGGVIPDPDPGPDPDPQPPENGGGGDEPADDGGLSRGAILTGAAGLAYAYLRSRG